eukprot:Nitzschia sp. Nitz4//scaffold11_size288233//260915//262073//NITZ4_000819-RA/size288233-snap-gene-0.33-mRNA-1//1//CDS//3329534209//2254//frame0
MMKQIRKFLKRIKQNKTQPLMLAGEEEVMSIPIPEPELPAEIPIPIEDPPEPVYDPSAWVLDNAMAQFLLMHTDEIKYLVMFGYTYLHGCKVFKSSEDSSFSYRFVNMIMACTGGGIMVPIFINAVPVPLAQDAYPIAILVSFLLHSRFPILREVLDLSAVFRGAMVFLYEIMRAVIVTKLTAAAAAAIPSSDFSFPLCGPIFCGAIAGCGGAFLPLDKGLAPLEANGLSPPMISALIGATFYHLTTNLYAAEIVNVQEKAAMAVSVFFIVYGMYAQNVFAFGPKKNA